MLQSAALKGNIEIIKTLLSHGSIVDIVTEKFGSAVHCACVSGNLACLEMLLSHSDSPEKSMLQLVPSDQSSTLHRAVQSGITEMVIVSPLSQFKKYICFCAVFGVGQFLLQMRYVVERNLILVLARDINGSTPLHVAASMGFYDGVKLLVTQGAQYRLPLVFSFLQFPTKFFSF